MNALAVDEADGYRLAGSVSGWDVNALYARCAELRFSGTLELRDGHRLATVDFIGGDPVDAEWNDAASVAGWQRGTFTLVERLPDFLGGLHAGTELRGSLLVNRPRDLVGHCEDLKLTAELEIDARHGEKAELRFDYGVLTELRLDGVDDPGARSHVVGWTEGRFRLALAPLFAPGAPTPPPLEVFAAPDESAPEESAELERAEAQGWWALSTGGDAGAAAVAAAGGEAYGEAAGVADAAAVQAAMQVVGSSLAAVVQTTALDGGATPADAGATTEDAEAAMEGPGEATQAQGEATESMSAAPGARAEVGELALTMPPVADLAPDAVLEVEEREAPTLDATTPIERRERVPLGGLVLGGGLLVLGLAAVGAWLVARPRASLVTTSTATAAPASSAAAPPVLAPTATATAAQTATPAPTAIPAPTAAPTATGASTSVAGSVAGARVAAPAPPTSGGRVEALIGRGRQLLVAGHPHSALEQFTAAARLAPGDARLRGYARMARGLTGRGVLVLEGAGVARVCGTPLVAPGRYKLPAGTYTIERGGGSLELLLVGKGAEVHARVP